MSILSMQHWSIIKLVSTLKFCEFKSPISRESEPSVGMKFLEGTIHSTVRVDRTGFCPSEAVRVSGTFHNISPGAVKAEVSLTQVQSSSDQDLIRFSI